MRTMRTAIFIVAFACALCWLIWVWGFCRFYVGPDQMAIVTTKSGVSLPAGQILAHKGQMGIQEDVLGEGRHFRDPIMHDWEIRSVVIIPPGKIGVVTSKVGSELPSGEFLAEPGQKGIWRRVLGPGKYRLNPYGYDVTVVDAMSIPIGYAGLITALSGKQAPEGAFAGPNEKGVREHILQPGLYYANPREFQINVLEIGVNQVSLLGHEGGAVITKGQLESQNVAMKALAANVLEQQAATRRDYYRLAEAASKPAAPGVAGQVAMGVPRPRTPSGAGQEPDVAHVLNEYVTFPSRDGFEISLDMTVEFELLPEKIAWIYRSYGDLPAVVDKIIMPQILSITRNRGSEYQAKDFIVGEGREKFQKDITDALAKTLAEKKIVIHNALIRHVDVPMQILDPIQKASLAIEQDLTNKERQNTARKQAELNTEVSMIDQSRAKVAQETTKIRAEINADQEKQMAEIRAEAIRQVAEIDRQAAGVRADKTRTLGQAGADALKLVEGERAKGSQMKTEAFGDASAYTLWEFANALKSDVRINILHAGQGTLWTDLQKAGLGDLGGAAILNQAPAAAGQK